ncbi:MAG TPA: hypothetical protein VG892_13230 [Terriglobales bacterium]|jgi:hypothetical protein|nr:hypothetical protein [Terriglobales bacterium]
MKLLRRATEPEVIAEFLKNEFYQREFNRDREYFENLVKNADTTVEQENALRRALLFRRRGPMWRELPDDIQWWKVELEAGDLDRLFVFPRAHWRKLAGGNFRLTEIVERLRARVSAPLRDAPVGRAPRNIAEFVSKIHSLSRRLKQQAQSGSVLLIGTDETEPMLIFEGNHRLTAALLDSGNSYSTNQFQIFLGRSPRMVRCCWYRSSLLNLLRYAKNRVLHIGYDRDADIGRIMKQMEQNPSYIDVMNPGKVLPESKSAPTNFT